MKKVLEWFEWFLTEYVPRPKVQLFMNVTLVIFQLITLILILRYMN